MRERVSERSSWNPQRIQVQDSFLGSWAFVKNDSGSFKNIFFPDSLKHVTYNFILMIIIKIIIALLFPKHIKYSAPIEDFRAICCDMNRSQNAFYCIVSLLLWAVIFAFLLIPLSFKTALKFADLKQTVGLETG